MPQATGCTMRAAEQWWMLVLVLVLVLLQASNLASPHPGLGPSCLLHAVMGQTGRGKQAWGKQYGPWRGGGGEWMDVDGREVAAA